MQQNKQQTWLDTAAEILLMLMVVFLIRTFGFGLYQVPTGSMETTMLVGERFFADKLSYVFRSPKRGEIIAFNDPEFRFSKNSLISLYQNYVWGPSNWTKRIIGIPGDHVRGVIEDGKPVIYINDTKLSEPYLNKYPLISQVIKGVAHRRSYDPHVPYEAQSFYRIDKREVSFDEQGKPLLIHPGSLVDRRARRERGKQYWDGSDVFDVVLGENEYWLMGDNRLGSSDSRTLGPVKGNLIHGRIIFRIWSVDSDESWWILDALKQPVDFWQRVRWSRFFQWVY